MSGKGQGFERQICRALSLWWTYGKDADVFWRNRTRSTKASPDAKHQCGDIVALKAIGAPLVERFNIEVKTGYSKTKNGKRTKNIPWDLLDVLDGKKDGRKTLLEFWSQCVEDAVLSKRHPMLIFKRDYHGPVVCLDSYVVSQFEECAGRMGTEDLRYRQMNGVCSVVLIFFRLDDFLKWIDPKTIFILRVK
jgi:hypothetical protein